MLKQKKKKKKSQHIMTEAVISIDLHFCVVLCIFLGTLYLLSRQDPPELTFLFRCLILLSQTHQLTHLSLVSLLCDIGKQHSPRFDATERGVPSRAILFT